MYLLVTTTMLSSVCVCARAAQHSPKELNLSIDLYDEVGIGGGASGVSGGLLHPYSPKGFLPSFSFLYFNLDSCYC